MADGPQRLSNALIEQRTAIEPAPGSAENEWELRRDRNAELVLLARDLTRLGPDSTQPRELVHATVAPVAGAIGIVAVSHPAGFWITRAQNLATLFCSVQAYLDLSVVRSLAGFAAAGAAVRSSAWRADPNLFVLQCTTTAAQPVAFELTANTLGGAIWEPTVPLWVEPGRVWAITNHVLANTILDVQFDVIAPTTLGIGT